MHVGDAEEVVLREAGKDGGSGCAFEREDLGEGQALLGGECNELCVALEVGVRKVRVPSGFNERSMCGESSWESGVGGVNGKGALLAPEKMPGRKRDEMFAPMRQQILG